jgi:hypothetical protein
LILEFPGLGEVCPLGLKKGFFLRGKDIFFGEIAEMLRGKGPPYFIMVSKLQIFLVREKEKGFDFPYNRTSVVSSNNVLA